MAAKPPLVQQKLPPIQPLPPTGSAHLKGHQHKSTGKVVTKAIFRSSPCSSPITTLSPGSLGTVSHSSDGYGDPYNINTRSTTNSGSTAVSMSTPIGILWALLSLMVAGTCSFSFLQPFWFLHPESLNSFGMYSYCVRDTRLKPASQVCGIYGGFFHFSNLPSNAWQAACVLYGGGCAFLCLGALLAMVSLCMPSVCDKRLAIFTGYIQTMAVLIMVAGLLVFPLGLDSRFVQHYCEGASAYFSGGCQLGWGYMLGIMGCSLAMFCPFLSQYTDMKVHDTTYV